MKSPPFSSHQSIEGFDPQQAQQVASPSVSFQSPISYYERESRRRNRRLRDELRGAEVGGLLDLALRRGHTWDPIACSTALQALAVKVRDKSTSSQENSDAFKQLFSP